MSVIEFNGGEHVLRQLPGPQEHGFLCGQGRGRHRSQRIGKSTFLRCINGLEEIASSELVVDGMHLNDKKTNINKVRTEIGMVFQQFNLYLHMTVAQNIKLAPMKVKDVSAKEADERCSRLLERVGTPEHFFQNLRNERTKRFLDQILH
jgi:ABC-type ATPase involved in cell division